MMRFRPIGGLIFSQVLMRYTTSWVYLLLDRLRWRTGKASAAVPAE